MLVMNMTHGMNQPLDSRQLWAFVSLASTGSFTRTGKELFISQSAVSHAIEALEDDVGCRLLDRVGKKAHLTLAEERLLHYAEKILGAMSAARASFAHSPWGE